MNNTLQKITGSVGMEVDLIKATSINGEIWVGISCFLFLLLGILVITTSLKSKRIKELELIIKNLK